jgi:hypothetical protein
VERLANLRPERRSELECASDRAGADELAHLRVEGAAARDRIVELERILRQAGETIRDLKQDLAAASMRNGDLIFRRVGLDESCPDFVVKAVRTAYRKTLHPDARPAHEKEQAENRFKEAESVFDAIYALRKL